MLWSFSILSINTMLNDFYIKGSHYYILLHPDNLERSGAK